MAREQERNRDPEASLPDAASRDGPSTQNDQAERADQAISRLGRREYVRATGLLAGSIGLGALEARNSAAESGLATEVGSVSVDHAWTAVELSGSYDAPVVVGPTASYQGPQPASPRLRNVTETGFEVAVEEWLYLDGSHRVETVGYVAADAGSDSLADGTALEAGRVRTDHDWSSVSLSASFSATPVAFTQAQTVAGPQPVVTRNRNVSDSGLDVRVQEEEAQGPHRVEDVGYLAIDPGTGTLNGRAFEAGRQAEITDSWRTIEFDGTYRQPTFLADLQTFRGSNTCSVRYRNLTDSSVEIKVHEERSGDSETAHLDEVVGYLVVAGANVDTPLSELDRSRVERRIHDYVNERRAERGLAELAFDTELRDVARYHSEDMASNEYFSHTSPSGETRADRYEEFGYDCRAYVSDGKYYTGAENIAYTYYDQPVSTESGTVTYTNADELARGIVSGWMNSEGHRENILHDAWDDEGIGVAITDDGKVYATQNFC